MYNECGYFAMLRLKLNHVSTQKGPWCSGRNIPGEVGHTMAIDDLEIHWGRSSVDTVYGIENVGKQVLVFPDEGFQLPVPTQCP